MKESVSLYERLAKRGEFNASVRHIKAVIEILDRFVKKENLADILNEYLADKAMSQDEILSAVNLVLCEKYPYVVQSANLSSVIADPSAVAQAVASWNGVDLLLVYSHPDCGTVVLNPKNNLHMASLDRFAKNECVTVYAGSFVKNFDPKKMKSAALSLVKLIEGKSVKPEASLLKGDCVYRQIAKKNPKKETKAKAPVKAKASKPAKSFTMPSAQEISQAALASRPGSAPIAAQVATAPKVVEVAAGPVKMTPMYAVVVTNELFHNGNVEAWKRIIESYNTKYPNCEVFVYYDGERITNLNSLFKWGKVKRGTCIEFKVAGETIVDVAKLQRYLRQGASHLFEAFLKFPVNTILPLF